VFVLSSWIAAVQSAPALPAAPPISDELAPPQLMAVAFWLPYQPTELQDTELAGIS
jgi:hypothetical protein